MLVAQHIRMARVFLDDEIMTFCYSNVIGVGHGCRFAISILLLAHNGASQKNLTCSLY